MGQVCPDSETLEPEPLVLAPVAAIPQDAFKESPELPLSLYLKALARGHGRERALEMAGLAPRDRALWLHEEPDARLLEDAAIRAARGSTQELASMLLASGAAGAAWSLLSESRHAKDARDRIKASESVLDRVGVGRKSSPSVAVQVNVNTHDMWADEDRREDKREAPTDSTGA